MQNAFTILIQKCIYMDFFLNNLIESNFYEHSRLLVLIKDKNLDNLKLICHSSNLIYNDKFPLENIEQVDLSKKHSNNIDSLLELNLSILSELDYLKKHYHSETHFNLFKNLINSYFGVISIINSLNHSFSSNGELKSSSKINLHFFNMVPSSKNEFKLDSIPQDMLRSIALESISYFFNYPSSSNSIINEFCQIFFLNSPENQFYQYHFNFSDTSFKIKIKSSNGVIFYISKSPNYDSETTASSLSKKDAINLCYSYLSEKFKDSLPDLEFDYSYINVSYYLNEIEVYKFKYNCKNINNVKSLFIAINAISSSIQEIISL